MTAPWKPLPGRMPLSPPRYELERDHADVGLLTRIPGESLPSGGRLSGGSAHVRPVRTYDSEALMLADLHNV